MSMYNAIFGFDQLAGVLLPLLGLDPHNNGEWPVGRFRDCFLSPDGTEIHLYTRNGGGNREHYSEDGTPPGLGCRCPACCITHHLPRHPNYLRDADDSFDATYATVAFSVPDGYRDELQALAKAGYAPASPAERWKVVIEQLQNPADTANPEHARALQVGEQIVDAIRKLMEK